MNLTHLQYFRVAAEAGSFTAAARRLRISQPSLSVAVRKLEEQLQTTLFLRDRSGVAMTATGRELLRYARQIFEVIEEAEASIRGLEHDEVGRFVLGCPEALGAYFLPSFLRRFVAEAPGIELSLWNDPSPRVVRAVLRREVDFGLAVNPTRHPDLVLAPLFDDATDVVVCSEEPAISDADEASERVRRGPLIFVDHLPQSRELLQRLAAADQVSRHQLTCGDMEMVKSLVLAGVGVGILPRRVAAYGQPGKIRRLDASMPFVADTIYLVYRADLHRTRASLRLRSALVEHGRSFE